MPFMVIFLAIIAVAKFLGKNTDKDDQMKKVEAVIHQAYVLGFTRAAGTLAIEKQCALDKVPNIDSLYRLDIEITKN